MKLIEFKQVNLTPDKAFEDYDEIISIKRNAKTITEDEFIRKFIKAFKETVRDIWDKNKYHIVLHSSGYDSRMLSWTIKQLNLSDLTYLCMEPEWDEFYPIMEYIGGEHHKMVVHRRGDNPGSNAIMDAMSERYLETYDTQVIAAGYFNEILSYGLLKNNTFKQWIDKYYYHQYTKNASQYPANVYYPILGIKVLKLVISSNINLDLNLHHKIIKTADPILFNFKRYQDK